MELEEVARLVQPRERPRERWRPPPERPSLPRRVKGEHMEHSEAAELAELSAIHPAYTVWRSRTDQGTPAGWYATLRPSERHKDLQPTLGADSAAQLRRLLECPPDGVGRRLAELNGA
ncbi:hypothetical protein GCM10027294_54040 [Marinactinospora endophytica]